MNKPETRQPWMDVLFERFRKDYFLVPLGDFGLFCIPNFVAREVDEKIHILLLDHVTDFDEAAIKTRLAGIPFEIQPQRLSVKEIEKETGFHVP